MKYILSILTLSVFAICGCTSAQANTEKFTIVEKNKPQATIIVSSQGSEDEIFAANELQRYIKKASGVLVPIKKDGESFSGNVIAVGRNKMNTNSDLGFEQLGLDGFRIKTHNNVLSLVGKDDEGTQYAVYSFLEKFLGIRWLWPGELGEVVPQMQTIQIGQIDDTEEPDYKWRNRGPGGALWGASTGPTEMHARELFLGVTREHQRQVELWEKRNRWGGMKVYGGHVLGEIFVPQKYAETHPEYYALVDGKRAVPGEDYDYKHGGQVCTSNPGVIKVTVDWVRDFFDKHPEYDAVHISMNDGRGFCQCENCRALDVDDLITEKGIDAEEANEGASDKTSITDRIFTFANQVAKEVQKTHPGKYVLNFAYSRYTLPPKKVKIHPFVIPQYCLWSVYRHADTEVKKKHEAEAASWAKASDHTAIYEYYINGSWPSLHRLITPQIAESIKYLYHQGYDLYQTQSGDEFAINGINYYVAGRLLWDTSLEESEILDDFYHKGFGKAADAVKRFHERLTDAWAEATADGKNFSCASFEYGKDILELFTSELLQKCNEDLNEAESLADDDLIKKRVEFYTKGLRYTELTVAAVQATKQLEALSIPLSSLEDAKQRIQEVNKKEVRRHVDDALAAWEKRDGYVEELKNDYVLAFFWIKYNNYSRRFDQTSNLRELSEVFLTKEKCKTYLPDKQFMVDSRKLNYVDVGSGLPVLFLHGADNPNGQWDNQIPILLKTGYRVIYPYLDETTSLAEDADVVIKLLENIDLSSVIIIGHSRGGTLARQILLTKPELVKAIVAVDSYTFGKLNVKQFGQENFDDETRAMYEKNKEKLNELGRSWDYPSDFNIKLLSEFVVWKKANPQKPGGTSNLFDASVPALTCNVPLLVFTTGRGRICPDDPAVLALHQKLSGNNTQIVILNNCGHWIHKEQPDIFNKKLLEFLSDLKDRRNH